MKMIYASDYDTIYVTLYCMRLWHHRGDIYISFITKIYTKYHSIKMLNLEINLRHKRFNNENNICR